jgi:carbon monoxide dehydrogenase subunit G
MASVSKSVVMDAAPDAVFSFVADHPERATSFIPGLNRIENVTPAAAGPGQTWTYEFNWFGLVISGNTRCTQLERPRLYAFETVTGNHSTWQYRFEPDGRGTRVTLRVDYDVPQSQLARFAAEGQLQAMNEQRAEETLANLKGLVEE